MNKGILYLIPSSIGETKTAKTIPSWNTEIINSLKEFIVEDPRTARRFLRKAGFTKDFDDIVFHILNEHTQDIEVEEFIKPNLEGINTGLLSEAGLPCIADPGERLVRVAHRKMIKVVPLTGPSSIFLALMASGFNGQSFCFRGYLPIEKKSREKAIGLLENDAYKKNQTQIFIEAPYRNMQLFEAILDTCTAESMLCLACDISMDTEYISAKSIKEWRKSKPDLHKRPVVFLLYK